MAGAGYKLFNTGDVLTAAQVNTYLQEQAVMVFADAAARTTALSGVLAEGMITYLKSDDKVYKYTGAAWVEVGGGSSPLTTKGDLYTYSTTDARLGVGANDTVLTADSTAATGLKWAAVPTPTYAFTTYTPTWGGLTVGNATNVGAYVEIGNLVYGYAKLTWGSTTTGTGNFYAVAPVSANSTLNGADVGKLAMNDVGANRYTGGLVMDSGTNMYLVPFNSSGTYAYEGNVSSTVPFSITTNDVIYLWYIYRKA